MVTINLYKNKILKTERERGNARQEKVIVSKGYTDLVITMNLRKKQNKKTKEERKERERQRECKTKSLCQKAGS